MQIINSGGSSLFKPKTHKEFKHLEDPHKIFQTFENQLFKANLKGIVHNTFMGKTHVMFARMQFMNNIIDFMKSNPKLDISAVLDASDDGIAKGMRSGASRVAQNALVAKAESTKNILKVIGTSKNAKLWGQDLLKGLNSLNQQAESSLNILTWGMANDFTDKLPKLVGSGYYNPETLKRIHVTAWGKGNYVQNANNAYNSMLINEAKANAILERAQQTSQVMKFAGLGLSAYSITSDIYHKHYSHLIGDIPLMILNFI